MELSWRQVAGQVRGKKIGKPATGREEIPFGAQIGQHVGEEG